LAKSKVVTLEQAMEKCFDGMTILLPGFVNCGVSETLIDGLMKKGVIIFFRVIGLTMKLYRWNFLTDNFITEK